MCEKGNRTRVARIRKVKRKRSDGLEARLVVVVVVEVRVVETVMRVVLVVVVMLVKKGLCIHVCCIILLCVFG